MFKYCDVCFVFDNEWIYWLSVINKKIRLIKIENLEIKEVELEELLINYKPVPKFVEDKIIKDNLIAMKIIKSYEKDWRNGHNE